MGLGSAGPSLASLAWPRVCLTPEEALIRKPSSASVTGMNKILFVGLHSFGCTGQGKRGPLGSSQVLGCVKIQQLTRGIVLLGKLLKHTGLRVLGFSSLGVQVGPSWVAPHGEEGMGIRASEAFPEGKTKASVFTSTQLANVQTTVE